MTEQTQTQNQGTKPSHYVYYTVKVSEGNDDWNLVGAAWPNKDGKGYTLKLQDGMVKMTLIMREPKPKVQ